MATSDFVNQLYSNIFGRTPSSAEVNFWVGRIDLGVTTSSQVALDFINSNEGIRAQAVERMYQATFGRTPDLAGFKVQIGALSGATPLVKDLDALAVNFANSAEFQATYVGTGTFDASAFLTKMYTNILGRAPDTAGLAVQVNAYNAFIARGLTPAQAQAQMLSNFSSSPEFTNNPSLNFDKVVLAYAGVDGAIPVSTTAAPSAALQQAAGVPLTTIVGLLNNGVNGDGIGVTGGTGGTVFTSTLTLTTGPDTIPGTSANDLIRAFIDTGTTANNTFSALDSIDGGTGTDRLQITVNNAGTTILPGALVKNVEQVYVKAAGTAAATQEVQTITLTSAATNTAGQTVTLTNATTGVTVTYTTVGVNESAAVIAAGLKAAIDLAPTFGTATVSTNVLTVTYPGASGDVAATTIGGTAGTPPTITNVEATKGIAALPATVTFDGSTYTGLQEVWNDGNGALATFNVTGVAAATVIGLNAGTAGAETVTFTSAGTATVVDAGSVTGSALTMAQPTTVNLSSTANSTITTLSVAAATTLNFTGGGGNTTITNLTTGATPTINVSGSNNVTVNSALAAGAKVISTGSGNTKFVDSVAGDVTFTGGSGNDTFVVGGAGGHAGGVTKVVDGGAGTADVLEFATAASYASATFPAFKNFEVAQFDATGAYDLSSLTSTTNPIAKVNLNADNLVLSNVAAGSSVGFLVSAATGETINIAGATGAGQVDTLAGTFTAGVNVAALNAVGVENFTFAISGAGATVGSLALDAGLQNVTVSGALTGTGAFSLTTGAVNNALNSTINASAVTGAAASTVTINAAGATNALTITGSATLANTITGTTSADTIVGGGVKDTITTNGGADKVTTGLGDDTVVVNYSVGGASTTSSTTAAVSIADYTKAAAITATSGFDVIQLTEAAAGHATVVTAPATGTTVGTNWSVSNAGVVTFTGGTAITTLAGAVAVADAVAGTSLQTVAFVYSGDTYVFEQNGAADVLVKLAGISSISSLNLTGVGSDKLFLV